MVIGCSFPLYGRDARRSVVAAARHGSVSAWEAAAPTPLDPPLPPPRPLRSRPPRLRATVEFLPQCLPLLRRRDEARNRLVGNVMLIRERENLPGDAAHLLARNDAARARQGALPRAHPGRRSRFPSVSSAVSFASIGYGGQVRGTRPCSQPVLGGARDDRAERAGGEHDRLRARAADAGSAAHHAAQRARHRAEKARALGGSRGSPRCRCSRSSARNAGWKPACTVMTSQRRADDWLAYAVCAVSLVAIYLPMIIWLSLWIGLRVRTRFRAIVTALVRSCCGAGCRFSSMITLFAINGSEAAIEPHALVRPAFAARSRSVNEAAAFASGHRLPGRRSLQAGSRRDHAAPAPARARQCDRWLRRSSGARSTRAISDCSSAGTRSPKCSSRWLRRRSTEIARDIRFGVATHFPYTPPPMSRLRLSLPCLLVWLALAAQRRGAGGAADACGASMGAWCRGG